MGIARGRVLSKRGSAVAAVVGIALGLAVAASAERLPEGGLARAEPLLKALVAKAPELKAVHLVADPHVVVVLDSDASGPRIRMNPGVIRDLDARYPREKADRALTVLLAGLIGHLQAGHPVGGDVLYTQDQIDEATCRAVRLLGKEWYTRYLVEVLARDEGDASTEVERLLSKCN